MNLNAIVDNRSRETLTMGSVATEFLSSLVVVDEDAIRYHIKLILLEAEKRDTAGFTGTFLWHRFYKTKEEYKQKEEAALISLDFSKIGRKGYTKDDYIKQRRTLDAETQSTGCWRSLKQCCFALSNGGSDFWASSITDLVMEPAVSKKLEAFKEAQLSCIGIAFCFGVIAMFYPLITSAIRAFSGSSTPNCPVCDCSESGSGSGFIGGSGEL